LKSATAERKIGPRWASSLFANTLGGLDLCGSAVPALIKLAARSQGDGGGFTLVVLTSVQRMK
jgi:hypothetical protein